MGVELRVFTTRAAGLLTQKSLSSFLSFSLPCEASDNCGMQLNFWANNCYLVLIELLDEKLLSSFGKVVRLTTITKFKQAFR